MLPALLVVGQTIRPPGRLLCRCVECSASPWRQYISFCRLSCMSLLLLLLSRQHTQPTWVRHLWKGLYKPLRLTFFIRVNRPPHPVELFGRRQIGHTCSSASSADRPHRRIIQTSRSAKSSSSSGVIWILLYSPRPLYFVSIYYVLLYVITHLYSLVLSLLVSVGGV